MRAAMLRSDKRDGAGPPSSTGRYAVGAQHLLPLLVPTTTKRPSERSTKCWSVHAAAGTVFNRTSFRWQFRASHDLDALM